MLLDLERAWTVDAAALHSKSKNTPFHGRTLVGQAAVTILGGRVVHKR